MNLPLAFKIISEVEAQPYGFMRVRGPQLTREVHRMAKAGLIKATQPPYSNRAEAIITQVTHAGHHFYRALRNVRAYSRN